MFVSCSSKSPNTPSVPVVKYSDIKLADLVLSSVVDSIVYIPLETNPECILSKLRTVKIYGNKIYAINIESGDGLYRFDINGRFLDKFTDMGEGPGEFLSIEGIDVDTANQRIYLLDTRQHKIIALNSSLELVNEIKLSSYPISFYLNTDRNLIICTSEYDKEGTTRKVFTYNQNGDLLDETHLFTSRNITAINGHVEKGNNSLVWIDTENSQLKKFESNLSTLMALDMGNQRNMKAEGAQDYSAFKLLLCGYNAKYTRFFVIGEESPTHLLISHDLKKNYLYNRIINDINNGFLNMSLHFLDDDYFYQVLSPIDILEHDNTKSSTLSETDNPILALYRIK